MLRLSPPLAIAALIALAACGDNLHPQMPDGHFPDGVFDARSIDAMPCMAATGAPVFESLMTGDLVVDATQSENTAMLGVALDRSVLFASMREIEPSPAFGGVACELLATGVHCQRSAAGTDDPSSTGLINIHWTVVTFTSGVSVQRGKTDTNTMNPATITLSPAIDPTASFVVVGGIYGGGTGWGNNEFARARIVDAQTLDVRHNTAGSTVTWQVVSVAGAFVQRGITTFATADTEQTASIMPAPFGGMLLASYNTDNPSSLAAETLMLQATLTSSIVDLKRGFGGSALDVSWEVISLPFLTQQTTTAFAASETTKTETVAGIAVDTSVAVATSQAVLAESSGSTDYVGPDVDLLGEAAVTLTTTSGGVVLERATSQSNASITWTAIDFSRDRCSGM